MSRTIIAHHLIFSAYGSWLPNDPRGSNSTELRAFHLQNLGPLHLGRKPTQPTRVELKSFYLEAEHHLEFPPLWFDDFRRSTIAEILSDTIHKNTYTVWACAILANHIHILIRRHKHDYKTMWNLLAQSSADALRARHAIPSTHPIWSHRPYSVYKYTPDSVHSAITYIRNNPAKENLPAQPWPFIQPYNNWPFHKKTNPPPPIQPAPKRTS